MRTVCDDRSCKHAMALRHTTKVEVDLAAKNPDCQSSEHLPAPAIRQSSFRLHAAITLLCETPRCSERLARRADRFRSQQNIKQALEITPL